MLEEALVTAAELAVVGTVVCVHQTSRARSVLPQLILSELHVLAKYLELAAPLCDEEKCHEYSWRSST